ncbi:MAG: hypothetical protein EOO16_14635 [Chitinophagaceae bacterium]|nr:MAG: hypothetical protein EOO16_14635 [Chitinophagaceae bacterium]
MTRIKTTAMASMAFMLLAITTNAQDAEAERARRLAAQKGAKQEAVKRTQEEIAALSVIGGTFRTFGLSFACNFNRSNVGFFFSIRGGSGEDSSHTINRGIGLNAGIIKHVAGEFYLIAAGGITELREWERAAPTSYRPRGYWDDTYTQGFETLFGAMYRHQRFVFQGGVSLMNFGRPEYVVGAGFDLWRKTKLN